MSCCKKDSTSTAACACSGNHTDGRTTDTPSLVRLPPRSQAEYNSSKPPVWAITDVQGSTSSPSSENSPLLAPLPAKCDRDADERHGVCCKDLKGEDERTLIDPDVVRDVVIGLSDGLTVPFALTAGLSSIGDSKLVVIGGIAELIAGAISMGVGGFLASQAERDHFRYMRAHTRDRVKRSCDGEVEREVHAILGPLGVEEKISREMADCLRRVEAEVLCGGDATPLGSSSRAISRERDGPDSREGTLVNGYGTVRESSRQGWLSSWSKNTAHGLAGSDGGEESGMSLKWSDEVGLTAFLLKFGEGMEEVPTRRLYISAFTIGMGYFLAGLVPLIPYFFINPAQTALIYSCVVTGIILLIFGAVKTHVTGATGGVGGYIWGSVSMLAVGGGAAAAAYGIVAALERAD